MVQRLARNFVDFVELEEEELVLSPASEVERTVVDLVEATSGLHRVAAWIASRPAVVVATMRCNLGVRLQ